MNSDFCVAIHALVYLDHMDCCLSSEKLADNICTNPARIRKVLSPLKRHGFVTTREGIDGGYRFSGNAEKLTLSQVAEAMEISAVTVNWHSGSIDKECLISSGMGGIMDEIVAKLNDACRNELGQITIASIEKRILG